MPKSHFISINACVWLFTGHPSLQQTRCIRDYSGNYTCDIRTVPEEVPEDFIVYPAHTHSFNYSSSNAVITARCDAADCPLPGNQATLTIVAPTLTTYGGTGEATATLTGLDAFNSATGKTIAATDIKYVGRDGTTYAESATAPTAAGKYTAKITVEGETATVDYEIAKANPTANAPTGSTATYGQTLADVSLTNPEGKTPGTWTWAVCSEKPSDLLSPLKGTSSLR